VVFDFAHTSFARQKATPADSLEGFRSIKKDDFKRYLEEKLMIVVSNRLQVAKGQEEEFEKRFEGRARLVENMPGFVRLEILRPLKSDYYIVLTHWKDEASFQAWTESAEFKEAHRNRPRAEIFSGPNVFEMHEVIQYAEKDK
jgi:heme oxygenase (mycobilin-producing)